MNKHTSTPSWFVPLALILLIGFVSAIDFYWIATNEAPTNHSDTYAYLMNIFRFTAKLGEPTSDFWHDLVGLSLIGRPPAYQLLSSPFVLAFGRSESVALLVNLIFLPVLIVAVYQLGILTRDKSRGLLAAFIVVSYAPVLQLSRIYTPRNGVIACCACSLALLASLIRRPSIRVAWAFGASLGLGMWMHPDFAYVLVLPTIAWC